MKTNNPVPQISIYLHFPYCLSKCPYCDFNSQPIGQIDHTAWAKAYARELAHYAKLLPDRRIASVYFGGGTPSLMPSSTVATVLETINNHWPLEADAEITLEANPSSSEAKKFADFRAAGVNRLSLGIQSLGDEALKFLGRAHNAAEARQAIDLAAQIFPRFSFDLIYARAGQSPADWESELKEALSYRPKHLSLYQLTIEPGTPFERRNRTNPLTPPEDAAAEMFEMTQEILKRANLPAYEISNHAEPGEESRHNLTYWRYEDYIGIGPGAHGRYTLNGNRHATENHRKPSNWLTQTAAQSHGQSTNEILPLETAQTEALMMGLRLTQGIDATAWQKKFGRNLQTFLPESKLLRLQQKGLLTFDEKYLRATQPGLERLDALLRELVA